MNARDTTQAPAPMHAQDSYEHLTPTAKQEGVPHVYTAMRDVQRHLAKYGVPKMRTAEPNAGGYAFRGIDDLYNEVCIMMVDAALLCFPRHISHKQSERKTSSGKTMIATVIEAEFDFVSALDGSKHTARTFGEGFDTGDKSTNKAMSAAHKYCFIQGFSIPLVGVDDGDGQDPNLNDGKPSAPLPKKDEKRADEKKGPEAAKKPTLIPEPTGVDPAVTVAAMEKALREAPDETKLRALFSKYQDSIKLWKQHNSPKQRTNWLERITAAKEERKKALTPGATTPPTEEKK